MVNVIRKYLELFKTLKIKSCNNIDLSKDFWYYKIVKKDIKDWNRRIEI